MLKNTLAPLLCSLLSFVSPAEARQQSNPPQQAAPTPQANSQDKANDAQQATAAPANQPAPKDDRILYTLPNYLTVDNEEQAPRLSSGEKYKLVAKTVFDWTEFPYIGIVAALGQAQNSEPSYGQGRRGTANAMARCLPIRRSAAS